MDTTTDTIHVTRDGEGEHWLVGTDVTTIKASARDTSGNLLVLEVKVPPGGGPSVLHRHEYSESLDEDYAPSKVRVGAGDTVSVPSMVWHNFKNVGDTPGKFLAIHSPAVMEAFVQEIGRRIEDPRNPPEPEGPPSEREMRRMMEVVGKYMEVLPSDRMQKVKRP